MFNQQYMSFVHGAYRVHDSLEEARQFEIQEMGYSHWPGKKRFHFMHGPADELRIVYSDLSVGVEHKSDQL